MKAGWGGQSRFYLPNEDAAVVCRAVRNLDYRPGNPLFVCGSGMVALMVMSEMDESVTGTVVDVSEFQIDYFLALLKAVEQAEKPEELLGWFEKTVYPQLSAHFEKRKKSYPLENVIHSLKDIFGIDFFFSGEAFYKVKSLAGSLRVHHDTIADYLQKTRTPHDFVYLSNAPDYMDEEDCGRLFESCMRFGASVYLLVTEACGDKAAVENAWSDAGFSVHGSSDALTADNRGLGSPSLARDWNRKGKVYLLTG